MKKTLGLLFSGLGVRQFFNWMPDKLYLRILFRLYTHKKLNINNPLSFNEKLQWLKLYDRNPEYTRMVDKYRVREFVRETIGEEYLIPLIGCWDNPDQIDFKQLPERFVLKCNHDSGGVVICNDKKSFDQDAALKKLRERMKRVYYWGNREWPYKNVQNKVIAEAFMEDAQGKGLTDYKIYCFNGEAKILMMATDRFTESQTHFDYFDRKFNWLEIEWGNPRSEQKPKKPELYEELFRIAEILSKNIPQVRVDLYLINGKIYFGEMTFFDGSGLEVIKPEEWDYRMGSWIDITAVTKTLKNN